MLLAPHTNFQRKCLKENSTFHMHVYAIFSNGGGNTRTPYIKGKNQLFGTSNCCQQSWMNVNSYIQYIVWHFFLPCSFDGCTVVRVQAFFCSFFFVSYFKSTVASLALLFHFVCNRGERFVIKCGKLVKLPIEIMHSPLKSVNNGLKIACAIIYRWPRKWPG